MEREVSAFSQGSLRPDQGGRVSARSSTETGKLTLPAECKLDSERSSATSINHSRSLWRSSTVDARTKELVYRRSCCECLLLGPLFAVYIVLQWAHFSLSPAFRIERVLKFEFMKKRFGNYSYTVANVHDAGLFWEWFEVMMGETVVVQHDQLGHPLPESDWGYLNGFNEIIGGVRLMQDRGNEVDCPGDVTELCYGLETDRRPFGYPACKAGEASEGGCFHPSDYVGVVNLEVNEGFSIDNYTDHFEMWFDVLEPRHILERRIKYLEDRHWIDKQTRKVVVEMLLRNDQYEPLLSEVIFDFRFDRTGYVKEKAIIETFPAEPYAASAPLKLSLGIFYVSINLVLLCLFLRDWRSLYRELLECRCDTTLTRWCHMGSFLHVTVGTLKGHRVEVLSILATAAQVMLWCFYIPYVADLKSRIDGLDRPGARPLHTTEDEHLWHDYHHRVAEVELMAQHAMTLMRYLRELSAVSLLSILLRHFKAWEGIPSFAAVTRTISMSAVRLAAVLVAAVTMVALFAGAAMLNYGSQLEEFHSVARAMQETAVIAMTGDPSAYDKMAYIDPIFATAWFWALISVMFMVVLNMILGILVDAASAAGAGPPPMGLYQQLTFTLSSYGKQYGRQIQDMCCASRRKSGPHSGLEPELEVGAECGRWQEAPPKADCPGDKPQVIRSAAL